MKRFSLIIATWFQIVGIFWLLYSLKLEWDSPLPLTGFPDWHDKLVIYGILLYFVGHTMKCFQKMADAGDK